MGKLKDKVAVVTGGNSGIGLATAKALAEAGAKVIITGKNADSVEKAVAEIGGDVIGFVADQGKVADISRLGNEVGARFDGVDILFINAGVATMAPIEFITEDQFDQNMNVNFKGAFFTLQQFIPQLKEGASVIFLSSVNAYAAMPNTAVYGASKAAMNALARVAATELAERGIRVNAVAPGPVNTPIFGKIGFSAEAVQQFAVAMQERVPLKRFGTPEDIAKLVIFLASDDAAFITGSEYVIDGGLNLNPVLS